MYRLNTAGTWRFFIWGFERFNKRIESLIECDSFAQSWHATCFFPSFVKDHTLLETYGNDEDNLCAEAS